MSLRKTIKPISFILLCCLLAMYSLKMPEDEYSGNILVNTWESGFVRFDAKCIHWISLRISVWIYVFLRMLRLENGFTIYIFIRQRNFIVLFFKMYVKCIGCVLLYFAMAMTVMAAVFSVSVSGSDFGKMLFCQELGRIFIKECIESLNFCLIAYFIYCCTKKMEIAFLITLACGLLLEAVTQGNGVFFLTVIVSNIVLVVSVLNYAAHNFAERIKGGV